MLSVVWVSSMLLAWVYVNRSGGTMSVISSAFIISYEGLKRVMVLIRLLGLTCLV
jgi:hypothetical protein